MVVPSSIHRSSRVKNPFKEKQNLCIRYAAFLLLALALTIVVLISRQNTPSTTSLEDATKLEDGSIRLNSVPQQVATDDENSETGIEEGVEDDAKGSDGSEESEEVEEDDEENENEEGEGDSASDKGVKDEQGEEDEEEETEEEEEEEAKEEEEEEEEANKGEDDELAEGFFHLNQDEFGGWVSKYLKKLKWPQISSSHSHLKTKKEDRKLRLNREILLESLRLGCTNIAENQLPEGNFNYQYNFVKRELDHNDNDVRQAGALWGIALCYQYEPSNNQYKTAVEKGIRFFTSRTAPGPNDDGTTLVVKYPDTTATTSSTGTNALFGLGMVEYLRAVKNDSEAEDDFIQHVRSTLKGIIGHLKYMQLPNQHFGQNYRFDMMEKSSAYSPYYDGETMLCLVKAAKYLEGYDDLIPLIQDTAPVLAKAYSIDAWATGPHDSDATKGFYQWSSMFLTEYHQAGWKEAAMLGDFVLLLSHWIIHTHEILLRTKNTGYAFEGIISAYEIAKARNDQELLARLQAVIDEGLYKLCTWQVGGPLAKENQFLVQHPTSEKIAVGGIMGSSDDGDLRIDTTQHQMHAVIMALTTAYIK